MEKHITFILNPHLASDSIEIIDLDLSKMLLMNDCRYKWLILVPRRTEISEIHHLQPNDQILLLTEIGKVAKFLEAEFQPTKINIGALGNIIPQLHIHIVARNHSDPAWPGPVWGHSPPVEYPTAIARNLAQKIVNSF
jgi:diadenosine tetraphosphate (Ap4A) HIT family hydrolase